MEDFAAHLKGWLEQRGWTRYRLAEESDVSESLIGRYLHPDPRRRVVPSPASCRKIARALDLDPDHVLALAGHRDPGDRVDALAQPDAAEAELVTLWRAVPDAERERARQATRGVLLAFQPVPPTRLIRERQDARARNARRLLNGSPPPARHESGDGLTVPYARVRPPLTRALALS